MIFHTPQRLVCLVCVSGHVVWHNSVSAILPLVHMEWSSWPHKGFLNFCILLSWFHLQLVTTWYPDLFYLYWRCFYAVRKYVSHNFLTWHHPLRFTYWKSIYSTLFCCLVSDVSSTVMPFKGETNIIFVHKSAVFTSSSGQLTSWVRDRLKMRTRTVGEPQSCVLFPYKAVPITADASDSVTFFFFFFCCTESLAPERESRPVYPSKTTWQVNARMTVSISFPLSPSVHISIPERQVRGVTDSNYSGPFSVSMWMSFDLFLGDWLLSRGLRLQYCHCLEPECACLLVLWL